MIENQDAVDDEFFPRFQQERFSEKRETGEVFPLTVDKLRFDLLDDVVRFPEPDVKPSGFDVAPEPAAGLNKLDARLLPSAENRVHIPLNFRRVSSFKHLNQPDRL